MEAHNLIKRLNLAPHPEGGYYRQTWRSAATDASGRAMASSVLFLLPRGEASRWHRVDGEELWIHQAGSPLTLGIVEGDRVVTRTLSFEGETQVLIPASAWQEARSEGDWTLVCCIVSPAFEFETFEMAPVGWSPGAELGPK